ncbi:NACHT domain-containing protein [Streptomyces sp. NPDC006872]|uniref:NACHT domain-containing protein n=1 Tax=Streptomyces sp. NPDC006872 TaxID=3155720 RepID=UPI0033CDD949
MLRWRWVVAVVSSVVITSALTAAWAGRSVEYAGNAASVLGAWGAVVALVLWARQNSDGGPPPTAEQLAAAEERLARLVQQVWTREAALRRLADPRPLDVRWVDSPRLLADHRALVGTPLDCRADDATGLATAFRDLARQRLVVIGPAGSGKTTLALLLTLALLRTRSSGDPVPVVLSLSSDVLGHTNLRAWLRQRLTAEYPALSDRRVYGTDSIAELLAAHRLLPVLDGLDEVPAPQQARVFTMVNDWLAEGGSLVLTCRTGSYERAVAQCQDVLTAAAVIEPQPLSVDAVAEFFTLGAAPGGLSPGWRRLTERLRTDPQGPAAAALTNPLNASMARLVYTSPPGPARTGGPEELADVARFPDAAAITKHLLASVVPALCDRDARLAAANPGTPRAARELVDAPRRLRQLAAHLHRKGTYDIEWWHLHRADPAPARTLRRALCLAMGVFVVVWCQSTAEAWWYSSPPVDLAYLFWNEWRLQKAGGYALAVLFLVAMAPAVRRFTSSHGAAATSMALLLGCGAGILQGGLFVLARHYIEGPWATTPWRTVSPIAMAAIPYTVTLLAAGPPHPPHLPVLARFGVRGRVRRLAVELASVPLSILGFGLLCNVLPHVFALRPQSPLTLLSYIAENTMPLVLGAFFGMGLALVRFVRAPLASDGGATPTSSLRADRRYALAVAVLSALALMLYSTMRHAPQQYQGTLDNLTEGLRSASTGPDLPTAAAIGALLALSATNWGHLAAARLRFTRREGLPRNTMAFLREAHRLGILRQVGPVYQFRHALLQDHLAAQTLLPHMRHADQGPRDSATANPCPGDA